MAKLTERLKDLVVKRTTEPGWYPDGNGLYLQVSKTSSKSWVYRYKRKGKERRRGLGPYPTVGLLDARDEAANCRALLKQGIDPIDHNRDMEAAKHLSELKGLTFRECAEAYIESRKAEWKNEKHHYQWNQSLETYAFPTIGELSVQDIDLGFILNVLEPIWNTKTETASRVRQRIETILDWAKVRQYREGENPARWRGHLDKLLPSPKKIQKVVHLPAMDYRDVPTFYQLLRQGRSVSKLALAFLIQTATRSKEAREAQWGEIDLKDKVWVVPGDRTKAGREQRIPLTDEALSILEDIKDFKHDNFVFPSTRRGKGIRDTSVRKQLQNKHPGLTVHGFRSSFRDWCAEMTNYPRELAEKALGHVLQDKVEAAYQRGDLFEKRRKLMDSWADYCLKEQTDADVVPINKVIK